MDRIEKALENTKRKDGSAKKWNIILGTLIALLIAGLIFFGGMTLVTPTLNDYFNSSKEITNLYNFYDQKVGYNTTAVYFIGASHVAESVYPIEINRILKERGYENITAYTIYVSEEGPLDRLIHLQKLLDSKPSLVIYGIAASTLSKDGITDDNVIIVQDRIIMRNDTLQYYTDEELNMITTKSLWNMKRFMQNAITTTLAKDIRSDMYDFNYAVDPLSGEKSRISIGEKRRDEILLEKLRTEDYDIEYKLSNSSRSVQAFNYILNTLENEGVDVLVVNAPINPLTSDKITPESRETYFNILNETGYDWVDMEYSLSEEYFFDGIHTVFEGSMILAPIWADLIIQEVESSAVHHT